jgi:catechol 2,3-dioxygenase-like lactoylglutathione lyase family enzyme
MIKSISAVTLATHDMPRAVRFYRALGFDVVYGGDASPFTRACLQRLQPQ